MGQTELNSQIFADFRSSWELQHFGGANFLQKTAGNRRNPFVPFSLSLYSERNKGGGKRWGGETYHKTPPQKRFFGPPPPPVIRSPPPSVCSRNDIFLRGNRYRPDQSHFRSPPKLALEGTLYGTFPLPPKIARYVLPPH